MSDEPARGFGLRFDGDNVPLWKRLSYGRRRRVRRLAFYLGILLTLGVLLFPLFWMFSTALRPDSSMYTRPMPLLPDPLTLEHFETIFFETKFPTWYWNSVLYSTGAVLLTVVASTLGGYGLTRIDIPYKKTFARTIIFGYMFPPILLAIPMYIFWRQIGILNTYLGMVLAETAISLPFSLWLMWKFFQTVPVSLEESAQMAGASRFQAFYDIALPMAKPGMIAVAVQAFAVSWNAFTLPKILVPALENWPLTVGLFSYTQLNQTLWGQLMAASAMTILPAFVFVYFLQRYLLRGFRTAGIG